MRFHVLAVSLLRGGCRACTWRRRRGDPDRPGAEQLHNSLTWIWWPAEFVPKPHYNWRKHHREYRLNLFRRRTIPPGSLVHVSLFARKNYKPPLPPDASPVGTVPLPDDGVPPGAAALASLAER